MSFGPMGMGSIMPTGDASGGGFDFGKMLSGLASRVKVGIGYGPNVAATVGGNGGNDQIMGMVKELIDQMKNRVASNPQVTSNTGTTSPQVGSVQAPSLAGFQLPYTPFSATPWRR